MNARPKRPPPTPDELRAELADLERELVEQQRTNAAAKTRLHALIAEGADSEALAACRRAIKASAARVKELTATTEECREDLKAAEARKCALTAAQSYRLIAKSVADARSDLGTLAECIVALGNAWKQAAGAIDSVDALMRASGVQPDPYILKAKLHGLVDMALHLETGGAFGRAHTLDNAHQLRSSGRCDLKAVGAEFEVLYLRRAAGALNISEE
jgi:hypothetical protein